MAYICVHCRKKKRGWWSLRQDGLDFCSTRCYKRYSEEARATAEEKLQREKEELQREKDARVEETRSVATDIRRLYEQIDSEPANGKPYYDCSNRLVELRQGLTSGHIELGDIYGSVTTESSKICLEIFAGWDKDPPFVSLEAGLQDYLDQVLASDQATASEAQLIEYVVESVRTDLLVRAVSVGLPPGERAHAYHDLAEIKRSGGTRDYWAKPGPEEVYHLEEAEAAFREYLKLEPENWPEMDGLANVLERLGRAREAARVRAKREEIRIRADLESREATRRLHEEFRKLAVEPGSIVDMDLSIRAFNTLWVSGITKIGQILEMSDEELLAVRHFGQKSLDEVKEKLGQRGFVLRGPSEEGRPLQPRPEGEEEEEEEEAELYMPGPDVYLTEPDEDTYEEDFDPEPQEETYEEATPLGFIGNCLRLLASLGLVVQSTAASGDGDVDFVAESTRPLLGGKFIVHCRDRTTPIGQPPLRHLHRAVAAEHAVKGILITRQSFTEAARRFAQGKNLELIDGNYLELLTTTLPPDPY